MLRAFASLLILLATSPVGKNAAHELCADSEEVGTVCPAYFLESHQPEINLIDQCRSLQRVVGLLAVHVTLGRAMQFPVNQRCQFVQCILVPGTPGPQ